ncbi:hypothetical protein PR048_024667 [Dryococelus australis]|uniref:Uncharacterized protein n=1 Tax=Dryococelus australis TaxID=614101 RepID=A0ABQ9GP99_9NEOP|nr:hypothetical protein PR048_024667 [Dryococelus australis]
MHAFQVRRKNADVPAACRGRNMLLTSVEVEAVLLGNESESTSLTSDRQRTNRLRLESLSFFGRKPFYSPCFLPVSLDPLKLRKDLRCKGFQAYTSHIGNFSQPLSGHPVTTNNSTSLGIIESRVILATTRWRSALHGGVSQSPGTNRPPFPPTRACLSLSSYLAKCSAIEADHEDQDVMMFNRSMLPAYYGLLRMCCQQSRAFTRQLASHQNLHWAFKNITPHPTQYSAAVVGDNPNLANVEHLLYLNASLYSSALYIIQALLLYDQNYAVVWELLAFDVLYIDVRKWELLLLYISEVNLDTQLRHQWELKVTESGVEIQRSTSFWFSWMAVIGLLLQYQLLH